MSTNASGVGDANFQKLIDKLITAIRRPTGAAPTAAPNAFIDRNNRVVTTSTKEFQIVIRTNPDGLTATARVDPIGDPSGAQSIIGTLDSTTIGAILA